MSTAPRHTEASAPAWKSWATAVSLFTDPRYIAYRLGRRWARLWGRTPPRPAPPPPPPWPETDLSTVDVDLVYLWVSGQDPKHREKRNHWLRQYGLPPKVFNPDIRYVEEDELRYSLRSVEAFAPWARKIFIITDDQKPSWLNTAHPKVHLVSQESIIPRPEWSPTFNSVAIEAQLHLIPGLAEHFIHINDDFFFGQPTRKEDFFIRRPDGRVVMKIMFSEGEKNYDNWITPALWTRDPLTRLWMFSYNNLKVLLELRKPWRKVRFTDFHQAQAMVKSELAATTREFPREYEQSSGSRFRNAHDINLLALTRYRSLDKGLGVRSHLPYRFLPHEQDLAEYTRENLPTLFCINAGLGDEALREDRILARLFPEPSAFETTDATAPSAAGR
jgi:Stealth protein CR2, conserved region 2/Stealth protein CR1, conserved region 1